MKNVIYNMGYFFKEAKTIIKLNLWSNIFSIFSTGLIFFILSMVMAGGWISGEVVTLIKDEAEISIYYDENLQEKEVFGLMEDIKGLAGVMEVSMVSQSQAYGRMVEIMGEDSRVLEFFDENPFSAFIEAKIDLELVDPIAQQLESLKGIDYIRDNRAVLDRLRSISDIVRGVGVLVVVAVGISTVVITSHIIRQGIYNNREQINTLRLLGAPWLFIVIPHIFVGLILTLGGGILAAIMGTSVLKYMYIQMRGPLPFIPLPPLGELTQGIVLLTLSLSGALGFVGSLFGLTSAKQK